MRLIAALWLFVLAFSNAFSQDEATTRDLIVAVEKSDVRMVKTMLKKGADVNMSIPSRSPFYLFFIGRSLYLQGLSKIRSSPAVYVSAIHANASRANLSVLKLLLKNGANLDARDSRGKTPLMYAMQQFDGQDYARTLLQNGANYTHRDEAGNSTLHYAALAGSSENIRLTAAGGIDINAQNEDGMTPFHVAAIRAPISALQTLIELGADLEASDKAGFNALHYAAGYGDREKVKFLYQLVPDLFVDSDSGTNPLDIAYLANNKDVALFFRRKGHQFGGFQYDELIQAVEEGNAAEVRRTLRAGANPNRPTEQYPLHKAALKGDTLVAGYLLAYGARVELRNSDGKTALELAIENNQAATAQQLLEAGSPFEENWLPAMVWNLRTPALNKRWGYFVEMLIHRAKNLDVPGGPLNLPALHLAAYLGLEGVANELLLYGANPKSVDEEGWTALHWAVMKRVVVAEVPEKVRIGQALLRKNAPLNARTTGPKLLPHKEAYLARRVPANATAMDLLDYALPVDSGMYWLLDSLGGDSTIAAADFYENGGELLEMGEYSAAQVEFNKALRREPRLAEAYCLRGQAKYALGMYEGAEIDFAVAMDYRAVYPEALLGLGKCRFEQGKYAEAVEDLSKVLIQGLRTGEVYYFRGQGWLYLGEKVQACMDLNESQAKGYAKAAQALEHHCP